MKTPTLTEILSAFDEARKNAPQDEPIPGLWRDAPIYQHEANAQQAALLRAAIAKQEPK